MSKEYRIGEVAKMLEVGVPTLRVWEKKGLIRSPRRRPTGLRIYTEQDIEAIKEFLKRRQK